MRTDCAPFLERQTGVRYRETSPARHVPFGGQRVRTQNRVGARFKPGQGLATAGAFVMSRWVCTAMEMSHLPALIGGLCLHRQRQNLLVEFADSLGSTDRNREQVCRELADAGAAFGGHFTEPGVNGCVSANLDLLARTFMRLGHAVIFARKAACTWYRHAV